MKKKEFHERALIAPGVPLTLRMDRLNKVPEPRSGMPLREKPVTRRVFIVPGPLSIIRP